MTAFLNTKYAGKKIPPPPPNTIQYVMFYCFILCKLSSTFQIMEEDNSVNRRVLPPAPTVPDIHQREDREDIMAILEARVDTSHVSKGGLLY